MSFTFATTMTPDGPFGLIAADDAVIASGWTDDPSRLLAEVDPALAPGPGTALAEGSRLASAALDAVRQYYRGDVNAILDVPIRQRSGPFRMRAWAELRLIPAGLPLTYGGLARRAGCPGAARAAGSACSHNSVALFVPCHRVVAAGPRIGQFGYRPELKARLLDREGWDGQSLLDTVW